MTRGVKYDIIFERTTKGSPKGRPKYAGVAEQADARDLKSLGKRLPYRFDPGHRHHVRGKLNIAG